MDYARGKRFLDTLPDWEKGRPLDGPLEDYLPRVRAMLRRCDDPQQRFRSVIVAGTNGKGTAASLLAALLRAGGCRVGLYTSPHLHSQRERIQIDGGLLDKDTWADGLSYLHEVTRRFERENLGEFSRFEALTVLAAHLFASQSADVAVFEVGLGGRYDATNAWDHDAAILTQIALDHCAILGDDPITIADEKLPVARPGRPLFTTASQSPEVLDHIRRRAGEKGIPLVVCDEGGTSYHGIAETRPYTSAPEATEGRPATWLSNARLAVAAAEQMCPDLAPQQTHEVLEAHAWPGRFETAREQPKVVLDGAHNPAAAVALQADLADVAPSWVFVVGVNQGHEGGDILRALQPLAAHVVLTSSDHPKALAAEQLAAQVPSALEAHVEGVWRIALERALALAGPEGHVCVTGSLHLAARAREFFSLPHEPEGISEDVSRESLECLTTACERLDLTTRTVTEDGNVMRVSGGPRPLLFYRNKHPFNDYVAARMAEDKGYQYELLTAANLPVPFTMQLFNPYADDRFHRYLTHRTVDEMVADVDASMVYPVLVKKPRSSLAQGVYPAADSNALAARLQELFENAGFLDNLLLVQSFVGGPEFRAVASQGELLLAYEKVSDEAGGSDLNPLHHHSGRAVRVGDATTIAELAGLTAAVADVVDLGFYAIDLIHSVERGWHILELNPNPFCYFYNRTNGRADFVDIYEKLLRKYLL